MFTGSQSSDAVSCYSWLYISGEMLFNKLLWGSTYRNVTWTSNVNNHTFFFSTCSFYTLCMLCFTHFSNMLEFSHDLFFQDSFIFTSRACDSQVNNCFFTLSHIVYMLLSVYFNALSGHKVEIHFHIFQIWLHIIHIITHGNKQTTKKKILWMWYFNKGF